MVKIISREWVKEDDPMFTGRVIISSKKSNDGSDSKMAKSTPMRYAEEDDPIFTGKVTISSKKAKIEPEEVQEDDKAKTEDN